MRHSELQQRQRRSQFAAQTSHWSMGTAALICALWLSGCGKTEPPAAPADASAPATPATPSAPAAPAAPGQAATSGETAPGTPSAAPSAAPAAADPGTAATPAQTPPPSETAATATTPPATPPVSPGTGSGAPTPPASPAPKPVPTGGSVSLKCDPFATAEVGQYMTENNTWGSKGVVGWSQCIGGAPHGSSGMTAQWTWDWKTEGDNVKAYPEVIFGHKPGYTKSTTTLLPRKLSKIQTLLLDYDVQTEREGAGNMAIDMWLTNTVNPTTFASPPITHEIMIWLDIFGTIYPGGQQTDKVRINGTMYRVFVGEKFGMGWRYVAFVPNSPMQTMSSIDLMSFFVYLKGKKLITTEEFLSTVNFGNELISGSGETKLNRFAVTVN